jgi:tetratricopeptide (TPR) repeat protein
MGRDDKQSAGNVPRGSDGGRVVAEESAAPKTAEELIGDLESAFRAGEIGLSAFIIWELMNRFPDQAGVARVYAKKILRDPELASTTVYTFRQNTKTASSEKNKEEVAQFATLGLLKFPADRTLTLYLLDALDSMNRIDLASPALKALGTPKDDDVVLLNATAALAQREGDYELAHHLFSKLRLLDPASEQIIINLSAAKISLKKYEEAADLLESSLVNAKEPKEFVQRLLAAYHFNADDVSEKLATLDEKFFQQCDSVKTSRVHSDINMFLQNFGEVERGLELCLGYDKNPVTQFELSEAQLTLGKIDEALRNYTCRFKAFPHLHYCKTSAKDYKGEMLENQSLLVWSEQGLGDELLFSLFFKELQKRVNNVIVAMDPRAAAPLEKKYPNWKFVNRHTIEADIPATDFACPSGDLFILFVQELLEAGESFIEPLITPDGERLEKIVALLGEKKRPRIGISWRGGSGVNGKIRSMDLPTFMLGLGQQADVDVISFQYDGEHEREVIDHGDRRIGLSGLNNRDDLEGVFCLLSQCDAVLTVDNAVAHFATLLALPTFVLVPAGQTQFRWKNPELKNLWLPAATLCRQTIPGDWSSAVAEGWEKALAAIN